MITAFLRYYPAFLLTIALGIGSFNLYYLRDRMEMIAATQALHEASYSRDIARIDDLLTDDFVESGYAIAVGTRLRYYKKDYLVPSEFPVRVSVENPMTLTAFNSDPMSLTFLRTYYPDLEESGKVARPYRWLLTYKFKKTPNGLKLKAVRRHFLF